MAFVSPKILRADLEAFLQSVLLTSGVRCSVISNQKSLGQFKSNWASGCITFIYAGKKTGCHIHSLILYNQMSQIKCNC